MKKLLVLILSIALVLSLAACGGGGGTATEAPATEAPASGENAGSGGETITVTVQFTFPEIRARATQEILDKITEASGGRLVFETYYSFSLFGPTDVIGALQDGSLDMAGFMTSEYPGLFPLSGQLIGMPFLGLPDEATATEIFKKLMEPGTPMREEVEATGVIYYSSWVLPGYNLHLVGDKAITEPSFSGVTLMTENSYMQTLINNNGGAAMLSFPPDFYANLNNGVANGLVNHVNVISAFGCTELVKNSVFFGEGGLYAYPLIYGFSPIFWESLPSDLQDIFMDYADEVSEFCLRSDMEEVAGNMTAFEEAGVNIIHLTDAEIAVWEEAFEPIREQALADLMNANPKAEEVYNSILELIAAS